MRHCCEFKADDIYYLADSEIYIKRKLSIGFCPICYKPVAELKQIRFDGQKEILKKSGIGAHKMALDFKDEILFSSRDCNYKKLKGKPYGWKYGLNKSVKINGENHVKQYACDFYGNEEVIKIL